MPTPYFFGYPTIGGLMMGSLAIECFNYADLTRAGEVRGDDVLVEDQPGRIPVGRIADDARRIVELRLRGEYNQDNELVAGGYAGRVANYYALLELVKARHAAAEPQAASLKIGADTWTGTVTVERMSEPEKLNPWTYELSLDLTVHGGSLTKAA